MSEQSVIGWPRKTGELQNHHMDSTRWNDFVFRDGDIVIATWAKSGTTWMQQIVGQLIFGGKDGMPVMDICPWLDHRVLPKNALFEMLGAQTHRRFMKTHLPVDSLVFSPEARYIYIGRDGRDAIWSWHNHHVSYTDWAYQAYNDTPGRVGPPLQKPKDDIAEFFRDWLERDGYPIHPFFSNVSSWWEIRGLPNVLLIHFNDMKADLEGSIRKIAEFLDINVDGESWPSIVEHCTFGYMKAHADDLTPMLEKVMKGGAQSFVHKGTNGRWRDILSDEDVRNYEEATARELAPDCARWLAG
jgi:aryl sulfotransferase